MVEKRVPFRHRQLPVGDASLHVVDAGAPDDTPFVFLHGWPQSWMTWRPVMEIASESARVLALDLPGVGRSTRGSTTGSKHELADVVHGLIDRLELRAPVLVGHDVGGMITYAYLHAHRDLAAAAIMNVVIPGLEPYDEVIRNPYLWHFAFHWVPDLPELLIAGHEREYFDFFFDALSPRPETIKADEREAYAAAYARREALIAGLDWYRALHADAEENRGRRNVAVETPVLYLRGDRGAGVELDRYVEGLRSGGLRDVTAESIPHAGHFLQADDPEGVWERIVAFAAGIGR